MNLNSEQIVWSVTVAVLVLISILLFYFVKEYNFKKITLIVVIFLTIIMVVFTYNKLDKSFDEKKWPPSVSKCPDYWIENETSSGDTICVNDKNLGKDTCPTQVNFQTFSQNSRLLADDDCEKAKWAKSCNLTWDGITNKENICK